MFEFIDSLEIDGASAVGRASVPADHPLFADHFPGRPLLPGTVGIELLAQVAGPLVESLWDGELAILAMVKSARFLAPVPLPAELRIRCEVERREGSAVQVRGSASRGGEVMIRGEVYMSRVAADLVPPEAREARRQRLARWCAR